MSKQIRSQDSNFKFEFEHHWGGERTTIQKIKGWIKKQKPPFDTIFMHLFSFVEVWYWEGKVKQTMASVDSQIKDIHEVWDNEHRTEPRVEVGVSSVDGLPTLRITNPSIETRSEATDRCLDVGCDAQTLQESERTQVIPDPWDDVSGDWNDWAIGLTTTKYYEKDT